ncbi:hypothetical protein BGZ63DRAFT_392900 [Mariannaea sp. PMI_226]|nr:hypothetical protein BGZ63DRAFT_392900 [Mariannaea sp. PMI_226]
MHGLGKLNGVLCLLSIFFKSFGLTPNERDLRQVELFIQGLTRDTWSSFMWDVRLSMIRDSCDLGWKPTLEHEARPRHEPLTREQQ